MAVGALWRGVERPSEGSGPTPGRLARAEHSGTRDCPKDASHRVDMAAMSAAGVTVIDQARGIAPRAFDRLGASSRDPLIAGRLSELERLAQGRDADGILRLALVEQFAGKTAVVSSFGAESAVLLHMIAAIDPTTPVLFLNT